VPLLGSNSRSFASDAGAGRHGRPLGLVSQGNRMFGGIEKWTGVLTIQVVHPTPAPSDQGPSPLSATSIAHPIAQLSRHTWCHPRDDLDGSYPLNWENATPAYPADKAARSLKVATRVRIPLGLQRRLHVWTSPLFTFGCSRRV
jgi:hypothetical protein